jgi:hypothetical protein
MSFFLESGLVNGFLSKGISTRNGDLLSNQRFLLSAQFGFGIDFDLGSRLNISLTNTYRQSLSRFFDDDNFKFRALGFATSMVYRIKK